MNPKKKQLIITVASPLTETIFKRIGAEELEEFTDVWVLDCLSCMRPNSKDIHIQRASRSNILSIASLSELEFKLKELNADFLLDFVGRCEHTRKVQNICKKLGIKYITHHLIPYPGISIKKNLLKSLLHSPIYTGKRGFHYLKNKFINNSPLPPDVALIAGEKSINDWISSSQAIIKTATNNYFDLLNAESTLEVSKIYSTFRDREIILFIDDCLSHTFDFALTGVEPIISSESYSKIICHFFDRIEQLTKKKVIVAGHPNGKNFENYKDVFGGRDIFFGETATLTLACDFAMTHFSSAIHYPVLLNKNVLTLTFNALKNSNSGKFPKILSNLTGCPNFDIENITDKQILEYIKAPINQEKYLEFSRDYIKATNKPGKHSFENLGIYIRNYNKEETHHD